MALEVSPPTVNTSVYRFTATGERSIVYGLGAIKGLGEGAIESIVEARNQGGPFTDLFDFCARIDSKRLNRRAMESLIRAGALDDLGVNRATLMHQLPLAVRTAEQRHAQQAAGQADLFGLAEQAAAPPPLPDHLAAPQEEWEDEQRLQGEKDTLGLFLSGHPIDRYAADLEALSVTPLGRLSADDAAAPAAGGGRRGGGRTVLVAGLVLAVAQRRTARGAEMASVLLEDRSGRMEVALFSEALARHRELLSADAVLLVEAQVVVDEYRGGVSLRAETVSTIEDTRIARASGLELLCAPGEAPADGYAAQLLALLGPHRGGACRVTVRYERADAGVLLRLGESWAVRPADALLRELRRELGPTGVRLHYGLGGSGLGGSAPQSARLAV